MSAVLEWMRSLWTEGFLVPIGVAFGISWIVTWVTTLWYTRNGWLDASTKKEHPKHIHTGKIPRGGGVPVLVAIVIGVLLFLPLHKSVVGILIGALLLLITGVLDDILDVHPKVRLLIGFVAAGCVVLSGVGIPYLSNPFSDSVILLNEPQIPVFFMGKMRTIWVLADLFAFVWIVGVMNFVNWSKGLDGQLPGMVVIAALTIGVLSQRFSPDVTQWSVAILAVLVAGAYLGFLPWNVFPQKIMPGYGGGALAGYFLAVLAILSSTKVGTLLVVLGVPLIDAVFVVARRILAGKSPIWGDTRHLHHILLRLGWSKRQVAWFYWGITAVLGLVALHLNSQQKLYTIVLIIVAFLAFLLWIKQFGFSSKRLDRDSG